MFDERLYWFRKVISKSYNRIVSWVLHRVMMWLQDSESHYILIFNPCSRQPFLITINIAFHLSICPILLLLWSFLILLQQKNRRKKSLSPFINNLYVLQHISFLKTPWHFCCGAIFFLFCFWIPLCECTRSKWTGCLCAWLISCCTQQWCRI